MKGLFSALRFLTIIPLGKSEASDKDRLPQATAYFPLVGLLLGLILAAANSLLLFLALEQFFVSVALVTLLIVLTGGLHLDGLADTFDALSSRKSGCEMLKIMRDSHIGTMGALSLICVILLKLSLLYSLGSETTNLSLILMCILGRYALVLAIFLFPYAREEGKAKVFIEGKNWKTFSLATAISLFCAFGLLGLKGVVALIMAVVFALFVGKFITKKIGGMTGDTLGAINELTEVFALLNMLILTRFWI